MRRRLASFTAISTCLLLAALGLSVAAPSWISSLISSAAASAVTSGGAASAGAPDKEATQPVPDESPSPNPQLDMNFLLLPSYDLKPGTTTPASNSASPTPAPTSHQVGDQIVLDTQPAVELPKDSKGPLKVTVPPGSSSLTDQGWAVTSKSQPNGFELIAVPLKPGKLTLPSLAIQDASGKSIGRTNPWTTTVASAIKPDDPHPDKPADLRPPVDLSFPWWVVGVLSGLGLIVLGVLIYGLIRWSRGARPLPPKPAEPPKPEDEVALAALTQLEQSGALARGDFKTHYFRVSEILKTYIGDRYGFDAPESTTSEMMVNLERAMRKELYPDMNRVAALIQLFDQLDRVKFTDHVPDSSEASQILVVARDFVRGTRRRPVVPVAPTVNGTTGGANASR